MESKSAETKSKQNKNAKQKHSKAKKESQSKKKEFKTQDEVEGEKTGISEEEEDFKGRIDVHTLNYFKRVEKLLEEGFEDKESQELFLNNVLDQVGQGLRTCQLAKHRLTSKILETLLAFCNATQYLGVFKSLLEDVVIVSDDRFGSHVIQKAVTLIPNHINCDNIEVRSEIEEAVLKLARIMKKNISELMRSVYACHIISCLIQVLGGMEISDLVSRSRNSRMTRKKFFKKGAVSIQQGSSVCDNLFQKSTKPTPESFKKTLHRIGKEILKDDNFGELLCHRNASPVIQTTLLTLKENDLKLCNKICNLVVEKSRLLEWKTDHEVDIASSNARVPILFADEVGSHVMEKIFHVAPQDLHQLLFNKCFKHNLLLLSLHPLANYILQHMFSTIPTKEMAEEALEELIPFLEDVLASGFMGVAVRMAELCVRFKCQEKEFIKALKKALHLPETRLGGKAFLRLLLTLTTHDVAVEALEDAKERNSTEKKGESKSGKIWVSDWKLTREAMNYHGACLAKTLFQFNRAKILTRSLISMSDEHLFLVKHEHGSFVVEQFLTSQTVPQQRKRRFLSKIEGKLVTMATDKFGSRVVDKLWSNENQFGKEIIANELRGSLSLLRGNMYGRCVLRNCGIESFQIRNIFYDDDGVQTRQQKKVKEEEKRNKASENAAQEATGDAKTGKQNGGQDKAKGGVKRKQASENDSEGETPEVKKVKKKEVQNGEISQADLERDVKAGKKRKRASDYSNVKTTEKREPKTNTVSKSLYDEEFKKLGICVNGEDIEETDKDSSTTHAKSKSIAKQSSNEIDELFAKGKLITKGKKRTKGNID